MERQEPSNQVDQDQVQPNEEGAEDNMENENDQANQEVYQKSFHSSQIAEQHQQPPPQQKQQKSHMISKHPLNYRISTVTSQDHDHPALDLVEQISELR